MASMYNVALAGRTCPERNGDAFAEAMLGMMREENHK